MRADNVLNNIDLKTKTGSHPYDAPQSQAGLMADTHRKVDFAAYSHEHKRNEESMDSQAEFVIGTK